MPNQDMIIYTPFRSLTAEEQVRFNQRWLPMFVGGSIQYDDAFENHRYLRFRLYLETGPDVDPERLSLVPCPEGNRSN
jgi:hypothetical protein